MDPTKKAHFKTTRAPAAPRLLHLAQKTWDLFSIQSALRGGAPVPFNIFIQLTRRMLLNEITPIVALCLRGSRGNQLCHRFFWVFFGFFFPVSVGRNGSCWWFGRNGSRGELRPREGSGDVGLNRCGGVNNIRVWELCTCEHWDWLNVWDLVGYLIKNEYSVLLRSRYISLFQLEGKNQYNSMGGIQHWTRISKNKIEKRLPRHYLKVIILRNLL